MELPLEYFIKIRNLIYERTGIRFEENKIYYVKKRLQQRITMGGYQGIEEYLRFLRLFDRDGREFQNLINLLTVNETYFFREFSQLQIFAEHCLKEVVERKLKQKENTIKVFSAGCSTGAEPYTLAIILREMVENFNWWNVMIKGVDIDENVLAQARSGIYDSRAVKDVPEIYLSRYFTHPKPGQYIINPEIKDLVVFTHMNLMDRQALRYEQNYDFIFCRNVLIYFDDVSRKQLVDRYYTMLNKGGYIFLGHAESLSRISTAFKIRRVDGYIVYHT
ncbi:MAG: CheR family methyltransferase [Syntrophomonadaceae bacterium]